MLLVQLHVLFHTAHTQNDYSKPSHLCHVISWHCVWKTNLLGWRELHQTSQCRPQVPNKHRVFVVSNIHMCSSMCACLRICVCVCMHVCVYTVYMYMCHRHLLYSLIMNSWSSLCTGEIYFYSIKSVLHNFTSPEFDWCLYSLLMSDIDLTICCHNPISCVHVRTCIT